MWNNETELNFMEIYQTEPVLWEPNNKFHKDKKKLHDAWVRISEQTGFPVIALKKKKDSLMATYRGHLRKIQNSLKSGTGLEDVHKPIWFAFNLMDSFLGHLYKCKNTINTENQELQTKYPNRITVNIADFFGMWKLAFKDKMDDGNRIPELLGDLATDDNDRIVKIVGSMPGLSFVKHLITNIVFYNSTNKLGRPDLFITMPAHHYEFLTDRDIQESKHKLVPTLFQLLFSCKVLTTVPKVHFLPWTQQPQNKRVTMMDEHSHYLVNITLREKLPCPPDYLPLLWYFFKPQVFSKSTRIIPMLEQWIPGCGVWLITGQDPPDTDRGLAPGPGDAQLPHMTIFTEFGDLNLGQKITVFKRFISWPEFEQCQFRITMENNLPKYVTQLEDNDKGSIGTHIEDIEHSDSEPET